MRVKITDHNPPGSTFVTPSGMVRTDPDGFADVSPEQLAHLKQSSHLRITGDVPSGGLTTRAMRSKKGETV